MSALEGVAGVAIATSPAVMAHVTTQTGVVTMIIMVLVAGYLLTRRAADFDKAEPKSPRATTIRHRCTNGRYGGHPLISCPAIHSLTLSAEMATRTSGVLVATCLSTLVVNANTSAVSILLPATSEDTGMSVDTLHWAVTGYYFVGAVVMVTSGALGDVFGPVLTTSRLNERKHHG
jgi:hypothetical protein